MVTLLTREQQTSVDRFVSSCAVSSTLIFECALGIAFISDNFELAQLHLVKEGQHQTGIQSSDQQILRASNVKRSFESRQVANLDRRVIRTHQRSSEVGFPRNSVFERETAICPSLFHAFPLSAPQAGQAIGPRLARVGLRLTWFLWSYTCVVGSFRQWTFHTSLSNVCF